MGNITLCPCVKNNPLLKGTTEMTTRFEIVIRKRAVKGFKAVIVDNQHPSGVAGVPVRNFKTVEDAVKHLAGRPHTLTVQQ
jgi:hypothetical protein